MNRTILTLAAFVTLAVTGCGSPPPPPITTNGHIEMCVYSVLLPVNILGPDGKGGTKLIKVARLCLVCPASTVCPLLPVPTGSAVGGGQTPIALQPPAQPVPGGGAGNAGESPLGGPIIVTLIAANGANCTPCVNDADGEGVHVGGPLKPRKPPWPLDLVEVDVPATPK